MAQAGTASEFIGASFCDCIIGHPTEVLHSFIRGLYPYPYPICLIA